MHTRRIKNRWRSRGKGSTALLIFFVLCLPGIFGEAGRGQAAAGPAQTHQSSMRGPDLPDDCSYCHDNPYPGYFKDGLPLVNTTVCDPCHSPDGQFDGVNDPVIGAKANWQAGGVYAGDHLKPGREKWCVGCHDDGSCVIETVAAPNIAGKSLTGDWQSPALIAASGIQGAENLLDHNVNTGTTGTAGGYITFDLAQSTDVTHVRLYTASGLEVNWSIDGGDDLSCSTRVLLGSSTLFGSPTWKTGPAEGWNEVRLDRFIPVRYLKLVKVSGWPLTVNCLREFEFKKDLQYGYYRNGHKIRCDGCHDLASAHIDGVARTYQASRNNYQSGYRLRSVEVNGQTVPPLEIPRTGCNSGEYPRTDNDFALCFSCHDKYKLLSDAYASGNFYQDPPATNFRNEDHPDANGKVKNEHLRHLQGRGNCGNTMDWDSDWDGTGDSPQSCPACHNVHGSPSPAMTRHGELASTPGTADKAPMFNFQYLDTDGKQDADLSDVMQSTGGCTQFSGPGPGSVNKNKMCNMCHPDQMTYHRAPVNTCQDCHSQYVQSHPSHHTHLAADRGPSIGCWDCHAAGSEGNPHTFLFADNKPLAETGVCDPCHSPDGTYDGVNDPAIGAKNNWSGGVYQDTDTRLEAGKETWCAGCHDEVPAGSRADGPGVDAPAVIGNENIDKPYGYYKTGHGKQNLVLCTDCHDPSMAHIDHQHRTYRASLKNYQAGYRLKNVNGGAPLRIRNTPPTIPDPASSWQDFALCLRCHNKYELLGHSEGQGPWHKDPPFGTNFGTCRNEHYQHLKLNVRNYCDSDFDGTGDAASTCTTCHNVHGSPSAAMIRHGELISPPGTQDWVPSFDFGWLIRNESSSCTWRPDLPSAGQYKVFVTWSDIRGIDPSLNSSHAKYKVVHSGGETVIYQNQRNNAGKSPIVWNLLGTFSFDQGTSGSVELTSGDIEDTVSNLSNPRRDALSYVIADAVKFKSVSDGSTIIIDDSQAEFEGLWSEPDKPISTYYGNNFHYARKSLRNDDSATRSESVGGNMARPDNIIYNHSCVGCHSNIFYAHPSIAPKTSFAPAVSEARAVPQAVMVGQNTTITAYAFDTDNNLASVTIDLSSILGSSSQVMYDDGTHGDSLAIDHVYSITVTIQAGVSAGVKQLTITAQDAAGRQDQTQVSLEVTR
ncbi:MAG: hypothetical protein AB1611_06550 [bacterium]